MSIWDYFEKMGGTPQPDRKRSMGQGEPAIGTKQTKDSARGTGDGAARS